MPHGVREDISYVDKSAMELTDDERKLLLAALYVLRITDAMDRQEKRQAIETLACRLGGDLDATFFQRSERPEK
jgi:hypothetical protein